MLRKVQALFEKVVHKLENHPASIGQFFFLFLAILALRLTLEFFSNSRLFRGEDVLHIGLWFTFIVLAFMVQLHFITRTPVQQVAKLVIVSFSIALSAPLIDILLHGGHGVKMSWLDFRDFSSALHSWLTIGGPSLTRGATLGIRIEIVLLVIASFNYIRTKTASLPLSIAGALLIYTVLFLSGGIPQFLTMLINSFNLKPGPADNSTILLLLTANLGMMLLLGARANAAACRQLFRFVPWGTVGAAVVLFISGAGLAILFYPDNWNLSPATLFWFPLLLGMAIGYAGMAAIHRFNLRTTVGEERYENAQWVLLAGICVIAAVISANALFIAVLAWGLQYLLNGEPLQLRRMPVVRNLVEAMTLLAFLLMGYVVFGAPMIGIPKDLLLALLAAMTVGGLFTDAGRPDDDAVRWFHSWSAEGKKLFARLAGISMGLASLGFGYWLWQYDERALLLMLFMIPPVALVLFNPVRTERILWVLLPAWICLAWILIA